MNALKKTANIFKSLLSVLFSIVLVLLLVAAPVVNTLCSFTEAKTIHKVIKNIDFVELVTRHDELRETLAQYGMDGYFLDGVTETALTEDLVYAYVDSLFEGKEFSPQVVENIVVSHREQAISLFRRLAEEKGNQTSDVSDEEFFAMILDAIRTEWDKIFAALPTAEDMGLTPESYEDIAGMQDDSTITLCAAKSLSRSAPQEEEPSEQEIPLGSYVMYLRSGAPTRIVLIAVAVLSVLIAVLRWTRLKGFLWLAVVYLLSAVLSFVCADGLDIVQQFVPTEGITELLVLPVLSVFAETMKQGSLLIAVIGILFLAVYIAGGILLKKRQSSCAMNPETTLEEPSTDEAVSE